MRNEDFPLFTVIIPQKNRAEYIGHTLKTCMIQDYPNFEVIVSDDFSDDNSVEVISEFVKIDPRIKLYAHSKHLGMRDNFEFALSKVRPGYVMALGGDDGLCSGAIWKMYSLLKETKRDLLTWPCATFKYPSAEREESMLYFRRNKNKYQIIKSEDFLAKISDSFYYLIDECPMFYIKGVAATHLVDRVKSRTDDGNFYHCPTPDGFSGVVLAGEVDDYVYCSEPLSIGGNTKKSQGQNYMRTDEKSRAEAEQFFNDNIRRTMHKNLASQPYSPLITLMTADYLLTAKDLPGWKGKGVNVSIENLLRKTFSYLVKEPFDNKVLVRELKILREIAIQHDLVDLYNELFKSTVRKVVNAQQIKGLVITNSIRINGEGIGINNVFDAAMFIPSAYLLYRDYANMHTIINVIINGVRVLLREFKYKKENLPQID